MTPGQWLALAAASGVASLLVAGKRWSGVWLLCVLLGSAAGLAAALSVLSGVAASWQWQGGLQIGGEAVHLRLDALSGLFLVLVSGVGGLGAIYSREYWSDHHYPASATRNRAWWSAMLLSMGLVLTASNGLHFLIAWEAFAICGYFLIALERRRQDVRKAAWLYLAASHLGTLLLFAFFTLLAVGTGSQDLGPLRDRADLAPLFWLALLGFGLKAGFFPLHIWLPSAHANAPSHVSAIMSGVALKIGIYGIIRFSGWLPVPPSTGVVLMLVGGGSAMLGIAFGFVQTDVKRLLAYCSVENVGIILVGLGGALLANEPGEAHWGQLALAGALLHVWNHGAFKSLLFLGAGAVLHATGTREMSRLGGLWRTMPWTAATFAIGAIAVAGLPPLNGFVSEWLVYLGLFEAVAGAGSLSWAAAAAALLMAVAGAITLASFVKAGSLIFLGRPRTRPAATATESGPAMRGVLLALAILCVGLGLLPNLVWPALARASGAWRAVGAAVPTASPLGSLAGSQFVLIVLGLFAAAALWWKAFANGSRRAATWGCGYAWPAARMQYSAGSFSAIAAGWFRWVLRPTVVLRRPRAILPWRAMRLEHTGDSVLELVVRPLGEGVCRFATTARRLQHGGMHSYIVYVLIALTVLGAMAGASYQP